MSRIGYGEWLPDIPEHENTGALVAKNCIAQLKSYRPLKGLASFTDALGSACLGSIWARARNDTIFNFSGDSGDLYRLNSTTWDNVSKALGYSASNWDFTQFGDRIIAVDISDTPQEFTMNTSALFADLGGSPPNAARVAIVRDFVVLGDVDDGVRRPSTVVWSGFNNSEQWTSDPVTQSGRQEILGRGGPIRRIIGGDVGTIFQENSITRMTYVGPPIIFRFDEVERVRGTAAAGSVVWTGATAYYYATDGFYSFNLYGGSNSVPIGANRVNKWFKDNAAESEIVNMRGAIDRENNLVLWIFKSSSSSTTNDRILIYNWQANRWSYGEIDIQNLAEYSSTGLTLDDLDSVFPGGIDSTDFSVDSTAFAGGNVSLLAFDNQNRGATFSGATLNICLDTKETGLDGAMAFTDGVRPLVEGGGDGISLTHIARNRLIDNPEIGLPVAINDIGMCDFRVTARYHRFRLTGTSDFKHANGVELQLKRVGGR